MDQRTRTRQYTPKVCLTCEQTFTPSGPRQSYCQDPCTHGPAAPSTCVCCGAAYTKDARWNGGTCSILCRNYMRDGALSKPLPATHWGRWYGSASDWSPPNHDPKRHLTFIAGSCGECGASVVDASNSGIPSRWCSETCARRVSRRTRKAREHNAPGSFHLIDVLHQYRKQGMACAYCHQPCAGLPDPEHVIPISRGGDNSMSNIVAACRACNGDKRDLTPAEWATDRERRGLTPVDTSLSGPAFLHLALASPTA